MRLGITMGDPGGIGPEVILKALPSALKGRDFRVTIFGAEQVLRQEEQALAELIPDFKPFLSEYDDKIDIVEVAPEFKWEQRQVGPGGEREALVQKRALQHAMEAVDEGSIDAIVTAPWNKALFTAIGDPVLGHTEILAEHFGADDVVMMLAGPRLRVSLVTTHIPIGKVSGTITSSRITTTLGVTIRALLRQFGIDDPRIAICGLNPHAGEKGHMGREEIELIEPVVKRVGDEMADEGVTVEGPFPADTLFAKFRGDTPYDAVICMYHDQGLIPLKLLHFGESANVTLGLGAVRTSVDHGTAYDIAGQGVADEGSMKFAIEMALSMVQRIGGRQ